MPTLYELTGTYEELWRMADMCDDGILSPELCALIDQNQEDIIAKAGGYCRLIRNLESEVAACKAEEARLESRRKSRENSIKRLKENLMQGMEVIGETRLKVDDIFTVAIQDNPVSVLVKDESLIPAEYFEQPPPVLCKNKLRDDLKAGAAVLGAELTRGKHLRIR